ncbi:MAG: hypothetical protein ABIN37_01245 [Burkholderiaceae bacterium]
MNRHWLVRSHTIRMLWAIFIIVLAATVGAEFFVAEPAHQGLAGTFGFGAWFGFAACAALILMAKGLGLLLKRPDTYYERDDD